MLSADIGLPVPGGGEVVHPSALYLQHEEAAVGAEDEEVALARLAVVAGIALTMAAMVMIVVLLSLLIMMRLPYG